jgi:hypothetical protein
LIESDSQLANTQEKLRGLEEHIEKGLKRPETPGKKDSINSLYRMARQLKEEIIRYRSSKKLRNVG